MVVGETLALEIKTPIKMKPSKRGAPKGNKNAAKGDTERLPWRLPVEWGIRAAIEEVANAQKLKPAEVLKAHFGGQNDEMRDRHLEQTPPEKVTSK